MPLWENLGVFLIIFGFFVNPKVSGVTIGLTTCCWICGDYSAILLSSLVKLLVVVLCAALLRYWKGHPPFHISADGDDSRGCPDWGSISMMN